VATTDHRDESPPVRYVRRHALSALGLSCEFGGDAQLLVTVLAGCVAGVPASVGVA
jgi:hypothetical protein